MESQQGGSNGALIAVIVLVLIIVVGWIAYSQGLFSGGADASETTEENGGSLEVNVETPAY